MSTFTEGTKVETNEGYFNTFGRKVIGTTVAMAPMAPKGVTLVRWELQEGNIIPDYTGKNVLMMSKDLQKR